MRRADRAVTAFSDQLEILRRCKILRLAFSDSQGLYIVPVSFGYTVAGEALTLYLHSAREGRKVACMTPGCPVAFETDCGFSLLPGDTACRYSCTYQSLTGTGRAEPVETVAEQCQGLQAIMAHQTGRSFSFSEDMVRTVAVFRIQVETLSGKQRLN